MVTAHAKQPSLLDQQKMEDEEQEQDDGVKVKKTKKKPQDGDSVTPTSDKMLPWLRPNLML